tara:strand:- start:2139 stop:3008 length:870 start_codon:yes stop_codon:yes gene_type:complete
MKKIIIAVMMFMGTIGLANAKTIDFLVLGTPGGTAYTNADMFVPLLEKETGYTINKVVVDSCVGGTIHMKKSKNPSIWIMNSLNHEDPGCNLLPTKENFVGMAWGRAMAFCSNDELAVAVNKLKAGKRLTFAVSNSYGQHLIDPLVAVTGTPMKFVPYGSSGKSLKGFVAGDTDMLYTNMPKAVSGVTKNGIKCWANTGPTQILDMVPMTSIFPDYKYADVQTMTYMGSVNLSKSEMKALRTAFASAAQSEVVTGYITKKKLISPSEYGEDADWVQLVIDAGKKWVGKF